MAYGLLNQTYGSGQYDFLGTIINDVAVEIGLISYNQKSTVFGSSNPILGQLIQLSKNVGQDLWRVKTWPQLLSTYTFNTTANQATYPFPSDYGRMVSGTMWNRTNRLPVAGPLSPQQYEFLKGRLAGTNFNVMYKDLGGTIQSVPGCVYPWKLRHCLRIHFEPMACAGVRLFSVRGNRRYRCHVLEALNAVCGKL